ncbi:MULTISPECIES: hypothetical protein [Acinetobacter]|uniref:Uncharacterized protein n=1 Tax=Acinetobacter higginsii TaxID=70347 RepID=N9RLG7_9GAMM|nr:MULTISPECIES: hypothetical protein [Acinetobacter]ENX58804.1 hypothetical protein F902_01431 [Acinetobacter higginsii]
MATNWNAVLSNANSLVDILVILRKVLAALDVKADLTTIDEAINEIQGFKDDVDAQIRIFSEVIDRINDEFDGAVASLKDAIEIAAAGGAGENGWTDLLVAATSGRTQRDKNFEFATIKDFEGVDNAEKLFNALATNRLIEIREPLNVIFSDPNKAKSVLSKLENLSVQSPTTIQLPAAILNFDSEYIFKYTKNHSLLNIIGADSVGISIDSVVSSNGADGSWDVTYALADASQVNVGDFLKIDKVVCGATWFEALPVRKANPGELVVGFNKMGNASVSGSTVTLSGTSLNARPSNWLDPGDLFHYKGQSRAVVSVDDTARTITIASAFESGSGGDDFDADANRFQWWYYTKPSVGTISISGANVSGVGTTFLNDVNVGDILLFNGCMAQVTAVNSDTSLVIDVSIHNISNIRFTALKVSMIQHEGTWKVTQKDGNKVTVQIKNWNMYQTELRDNAGNVTSPYFKGFAPPVKGWVGATAKVLKTVLKQANNAGSGFVGEQSGAIKFIDNLIVEGGAGGTGLLLKGQNASYEAIQSNIVCGQNFAVSGFNRCVWGFGGSRLQAPYAHFIGSTSNAIDLGDGGAAYLRGAVVAGSGGIGLLISGNFCRLSEVRLIGNKLQGMRTDAGGNFYGDSGFVYGNASHGLMIVNVSGGQFADGFTLSNGGNGINVQNGGGGRYSRNLAACNKHHQMSFTGSMVEAGQAWATGAKAGRSGIVVSASQAYLFAAAATGNSVVGLYTLDSANVSARNNYLSKNGVNGANIQNLSSVVANGSYVEGNYGPNNVVIATGSSANGFSTGQSAQVTGAIATTYTTLTNGGVITYQKNAAYGYVFGEIEVFGSSMTAVSGKAYFRAGSSPQTSKISGHANFSVATGVLDGSNGTPGNLIVSTHTDGNIYIANQTGGAITISTLLKGNIL